MSNNFNPSNGRSTSATAVKEMFERLTETSDDEGYFCVMRCTLPAGAVVPLHSHPDRETFYVLSGKLSALRGDKWEELGPGDVLDVRDGIKHAWRNSSEVAASVICVTTTKFARFLREIEISIAGSSPEEHAQRFFQLVEANGYWLASPEENAAVGLDVNWTRPRG